MLAAASCPTWCAGINCGTAHDLICCIEAASVCASCSVCEGVVASPPPPPQRFTTVSIVGDEWYINGEPTFKSRKWEGVSMQGLLPNSRMVNAIYDDDHASTRSLWNYPDTHKWDADRHTNEFIAALPDYRAHGLLGVTVSLQGGSVCGNDPKDKSHPQCSTHSFEKVVSAFNNDGNIKSAWFARLERVLEATDRLGMVVLLQMFYPKQVFRFKTNQAVVVATEATVDWLLSKKFRNFVIDCCNECDWDDNQKFMKHLPALFWPWHGGLLDRIRRRSKAGGHEFIISSSFIGGSVPSSDKYKHIDYVNLHANNLWQWKDGSLANFVDGVRRHSGYRKMPIVITEDDGLCAYDGKMSWNAAAPAFYNAHQKGPQGSECAPSSLLHSRPPRSHRPTPWHLPNSRAELRLSRSISRVRSRSCYFHFTGCKPNRGTKCAFGLAVAVKASWGLFLSCCSFAS